MDSLRTSKGVLGAESLQPLLSGVETLVHVNLAWFVLLCAQVGWFLQGKDRDPEKNQNDKVQLKE